MVAIEAGVEGLFFSQKPPGDAGFEEPRGDISVGLTGVFSGFRALFDLVFHGLESGGLEVVKNAIGQDVGMAQVGQVRGKSGELQQGFEGKKAGFDAPTAAIDSPEMSVGIAVFVRQGGQQDFRFAPRQVETNKPVGNHGR